MSNKVVSVIIPAYNEAQSLVGIIMKIKALHPDFEIVVIDDGSTDDTAKSAESTGVIVCSHPYNIGNGAAVKTGIRKSSGEILVLMDGDGQHEPKDIARLVERIPEYDMVVGARSIDGQATFGRAVGNKIYNLLSSYVAKFKIKDLTSGFRAVKADFAQKIIYLLPNAYSYPTTLTLSVLRSGRTLKYIPIRVKERKTGKSNIGLFKDGVRFFIIIIKICTLFSPFRIFLPVSFSIFVSGLLYYLYTFIKWGRFTNMSALLFSTAIIIFMMGLISEQICQMRYKDSEKK